MRSVEHRIYNFCKKVNFPNGHILVDFETIIWNIQRTITDKFEY